MPFIQGNYTIAAEVNGYDLTLKVQTRTGPGTEDFGNGPEHTHTIERMVDGLSVINLVAASGGSSITDATLNNIAVSYVIINSGAKKFADFTKDVPGTTLTFTDATTLVISDTVDVYYLPDGNGIVETNIREIDLPQRVSTLWDALNEEAQAIPDAAIYAALTELGLRYDH